MPLYERGGHVIYIYRYVSRIMIQVFFCFVVIKIGGRQPCFC